MLTTPSEPNIAVGLIIIIRPLSQIKSPIINVPYVTMVNKFYFGPLFMLKLVLKITKVKVVLLI